MLSEPTWEAVEAERNGIERGSEKEKKMEWQRDPCFSTSAVTEGNQIYMGSKLIPESTIKAKHGKREPKMKKGKVELKN